MTQAEYPPALASEPGYWELRLSTGAVVHLRAHGYHMENESYVFSLLLEGSPCVDFEVLRLAADEVVDLRGG